MRRLSDALIDPDERAHLLRALDAPTSVGVREAYLDALDPEDERASALFLNLRLVQDVSPDHAQPLVEELLEIIPRLCPDWWRVVRLGDPLFNCHDGPQDTPRVRFVYRCPMRWDWLTETEEADVRLCGQCGEKVHRCRTVAQAQDLARSGACVSLATPLFQSHAQQLTEDMLGRPDPVEAWADQLFDGESA
jgi:hypothetical protein